MKIYLSSPGSSEKFEVAGDPKVCLRSVGGIDALTISDVSGPIPNGFQAEAWTDAGRLLFRGFVNYREGSIHAPPSVVCIPRWSLMMAKNTPSIAWPAGTTIAALMSTDPPTQSGAYMQSPMWLYKSALPTNIQSVGASGVMTVTDAKELSIARLLDHDIYYDGHLCTEVAEGDLTAGSYRYCFGDDYLKVRGTGTGDVWGVIAADGAIHPYIECGDIEESGSLDAVLVTAVEPFHPFIPKLLDTFGMIFSPRESRDGTLYIDGLSEEPSRGTSDAGAYSLGIDGDGILSCHLQAPQELRPSAVVGVTEGGYRARHHFALASPVPGRAWVDRLVMPEGVGIYRSDVLDQIAAFEWGRRNQELSASITTNRGHLQPGDWIRLNLGARGIKTLQVSDLQMSGSSPIISADLGRYPATVEEAFGDLSFDEEACWEDYAPIYLDDPQSRIQGDLRGWGSISFGGFSSPAVAAYLDRSDFDSGDAYAYGYLGPDDDLEIDFATADFSGIEDQARVLLSLEAIDDTAFEYLDISVVYTITINGTVAAIIRHAPWGPYPLTDVDITDACDIDGSTNSVTVSVTDPKGQLDEVETFEIHIRGTRLDAAPEPWTSKPNGAGGNSLSLQPSSGMTYYAILADDSNSTYCYTNSTSYASVYCAMDDGPLPSLTPTVTVYARVYEDYGDVAQGYSRTVLITGGTTFYGSEQRMSNSWKTISTTYTLNPQTASPWTKDELDGMRVGASIKNAYSGAYQARVSKVWAVIGTG